jgi:hypothetical protein
MNAKETAAYWVEYVIRHRGAPHLQYPGVHLNFLQTNSLDVIAFLVAVIYVALKLIMWSGKLFICKIMSKSPLKSEKHKKNN